MKGGRAAPARVYPFAFAISGNSQEVLKNRLHEQKFSEKYPEILDFAFLRWYLCTCQPEDNTNRLFIVIQTTEGRKDLGVIHVDVHEIFRRYAPLNDKRFQFLIFNF